LASEQASHEDDGGGKVEETKDMVWTQGDLTLGAEALPNGVEMSRPASPRLVSRQIKHLAGRVGSIELLGGA
jgi:hypothetical protein